MNYILIITLVSLMFLASGCNKQDNKKSPTPVQKVVFISDSWNTISGESYKLTCKSRCEEYYGDINSILSNGIKIISSHSKEITPTNNCICRGTEYILEGSQDSLNKIGENKNSMSATSNNEQKQSTKNEVKPIIEKYNNLNGKCRGGSGDDPNTIKACDERDLVVAKLKESGWCFGKEGQAEYEMEWHQCSSNSLK